MEAPQLNKFAVFLIMLAVAAICIGLGVTIAHLVYAP